ncbi:MAG: hypothetical protein ACRBBR_01405 [Cellvibrionaceae bacterium]
MLNPIQPHPIRLLFLMAAFLVPNSQAVIADRLEANMHTAGYFCSTAGKTAEVSIHYGDNAQHLPCRVTLQKSGSSIVSILEAKRNKNHCDLKAASMKQRLVDRGWHCLSSGI